MTRFGINIPAGAVTALREAHKVLVLTGSGVSAESGVPTFREAQSGLWENFDPHQLATPDAFLRDPELVWRWYRWRRDLVSGVEPNAGHYALVRLQGQVEQLTLVTQNVDGLHQKAGSTGVIEYHGNLFRTHCFNRCAAEGDSIGEDTDSVVPRCPVCGSYLRPGVVWFGEAIPAAALASADEAARECDVFLSVGTSSLVWPAAGLGELARQAGATVIEINIDATPLTDQSHFVVQGKSGEVLPELLNSMTV